jgi:hypothetical protein
MESAMEVDPDPSDPLDIPNIAAGAQNWTCTGANNYFKKTFLDNDFGHKYDICDRIWFKYNLKPSNRSITGVPREEFPAEDVISFKLCNHCKALCSKGPIPALSRSNGFLYPPIPDQPLPKLDPLTERLISPRLPYMQIRRLRGSSYGIVGQVINIPVSVRTMVSNLPRSLDDDYAINVNLKKNIVHKSSYLSGYVKKAVLKRSLGHMTAQPLYRYYKIAVDLSNLTANVSAGEDVKRRVMLATWNL